MVLFLFWSQHVHRLAKQLWKHPDNITLCSAERWHSRMVVVLLGSLPKYAVVDVFKCTYRVLEFTGAAELGMWY